MDEHNKKETAEVPPESLAPGIAFMEKPPLRHGVVPQEWQVSDDRLLVQNIKKRAVRRFMDASPAVKAKRAQEAKEVATLREPREPRERMTFEKFKKGMDDLGRLGVATHLRYDLDFQEIAKALKIPLDVCKKLLRNGRVFSQIGEEHAALKLGFKLHGHKDAGGSDGFREAKSFQHLVSVKGIAKSVCFQLSSLTGGSGGKYCDKEALLDCLDLTSEVVVVDARFEKVLMTQMPAEVLKAWVEAGLLSGAGMVSERFYSAVKSTCHVKPFDGSFSQVEMEQLLKSNEELAAQLRSAREDLLPFEDLFKIENERPVQKTRP